MKSGKRKKTSFWKASALVAVALLVSLGAWVFLSSETIKLEKSSIQSAASDNEYLAENMALVLASSGKEEAAVAILTSSPSAGTRYFSLYTVDGVVYEKSPEATDMVAQYDLTQLGTTWTNAGGQGVTELLRFLRAGNDFSIIMSKDKSRGSELISGHFFEMGGQKYCVTSSVLVSYLNSLSGLSERIQFLQLITAGLALFLTGLSGYTAISGQNRSKKISRLERELQERNLMIQEQGERIFAAEDGTADLTRDTLTGTFSQSFFQAFLRKLNDENPEHLGFIVISAGNLHVLYENSGYAYASNLLQQIAALLRKYAGEKSLLSRTGQSEFTLVLTDVSADGIVRIYRKLHSDLSAIDKSAAIRIGSAFQRQGESADTTYKEAMRGAGLPCS